MYLPRMCLLFFYSDDSSLFFIVQETSEKLKLSHSAQPENKPVKVTPLPFSLFLFQSPSICYEIVDAESPVHILGAWIFFGKHHGTESSWLQTNCGDSRRWEAWENRCCNGHHSAQVYQVLISEGRPCFVIKSSPLEMHVAFLVAFLFWQQPSWLLCVMVRKHRRITCNWSDRISFPRSRQVCVIWSDLKLSSVRYQFFSLDFDSFYVSICCLIYCKVIGKNK